MSTAVITGANRGIGLGIAKGFLQAGANLTIVALEKDTAAVAAELSEEFDRQVIGYECDIAEIEQVKTLASKISHVDVLVNNAGLDYITPITDPSASIDTMFRDIILINV